VRLEHLGEEALVVHKQVVVEAELTDDLDEVQLCFYHLLLRIALELRDELHDLVVLLEERAHLFIKIQPSRRSRPAASKTAASSPK